MPFWPREGADLSNFQPYRRSGITYMRPYVQGETLDSRVSISAPDKESGSPKLGDWIACNPANPDDQWLVSAAFFEKAGFERVETTGLPNPGTE